ncbi:hypothetical protein ACWIGM_15565 [Bosea sp. NPDC055332]
MIKIPGLKRPGSPVLGLVALNGTLAAAMLAVAFWPFSEEAIRSGQATVSAAAAQPLRTAFLAPQNPLFARNFIVPAPQVTKTALPAASVAPALSDSENRPLQWRVTGIIIAGSAPPIALIERNGQTAEVRRVSVGTAVEDWVVEQIASRTVSFRRGTASVSVSLDPSSHPKTE